MDKRIEDLKENYELEIERIVKEVKKTKAKKVLLQFPDAFKPYSASIVDELKKQLPKTEFFIWMSSCFGACDTPNVNPKDFNLFVQFGHSSWNK